MWVLKDLCRNGIRRCDCGEEWVWPCGVGSEVDSESLPCSKKKIGSLHVGSEGFVHKWHEKMLLWRGMGVGLGARWIRSRRRGRCFLRMVEAAEENGIKISQEEACEEATEDCWCWLRPEPYRKTEKHSGIPKFGKGEISDRFRLLKSHPELFRFGIWYIAFGSVSHTEPPLLNLAHKAYILKTFWR
ncbi:hypothetical protein C1H46_027327 [Malus baccata]|uniref:Uncharacterized protein n=1 Tax=Malus baccata TaxID=106549 RepID=A0A540LKW0_MALBA|nr:hypothetical protein C1H46_027327 [Malus baccata]